MQLDADHPDLFGLENLPYGVYSLGSGRPRVGVRYRDLVVDLGDLLEEARFRVGSLNGLLALDVSEWQRVRREIQRRLAQGVPPACASRLQDVTVHMPIDIGDYVDFYASEQHAANLGRIFRPDVKSPLTPNWKYLPISYHGRSSSILVSETAIRRPNGQRRGAESEPSVYGPTQRLDFEAELGFVVGGSTPVGTPIPIDEAQSRLFGVMLFNDWSARDIQSWEYVPLGPHLGKSFASSMSGWIVPMLALEEAKIPLPTQVPEPLPHLAMARPWGLDIDLSVELNDHVISRPRCRDLYWSPAQMLAHMTSNGAPTRPGDVFASGTVSGEDLNSWGCLAELTRDGTSLINLGEETRGYLDDGDVVTLSATAPGARDSRIGFGTCTGRIVPSAPIP